MDDPQLFKILSTATFAVGLVFLVLFAREPWRKNWYGTSVIVLALGVTLFALTTVLRQWFGMDYPGRQVIRVSAQLLILAAMLERTIELAVIKHKRARKKRRQREQPDAPEEPDPIGPNGTLHPPRRKH